MSSVKIVLPFLFIALLLLGSGCSLFSSRGCPSMDRQAKKLISGKETYGVKNNKYKKQNRKALCYYKK